MACPYAHIIRGAIESCRVCSKTRDTTIGDCIVAHALADVTLLQE
jgi:hypothetical protein